MVLVCTAMAISIKENMEPRNIAILAFDPIFEYQGRTYAEMSFEEKVNLCFYSHK